MSTVIYKRLLARVECLAPGEWTDLTASGKPALCCAECGSVFDLPDTHRVDETGFIVPAVKCPSVTCVSFSYLRLEAWGEAVVR